MSFASGAGSYDRFMGRYSNPLAPLFADLAGIVPGMHVLDVGCGTGALTAELVSRVGAGKVSAIDPSATFVEAVSERLVGVDVRRAPAEQIPFADKSFHASLAQLVVHFMADPVAGFREMRRVTRRGGMVAACVWDFGDGGGPLGPFWNVVRELHPEVEGEADLAGARQGHLARLLGEAGLSDVREGALTVTVEHATFEEWWEPFTLGVGPAGAYVAGLTAFERGRLRDSCRATLLRTPFVVSGRAWAAWGTT